MPEGRCAGGERTGINQSFWKVPDFPTDYHFALFSYPLPHYLPGCSVASSELVPFYTCTSCPILLNASFTNNKEAVEDKCV